jgi:glyoxylase-like metal-dependent hydrolase (beta-lactamase superfamily II)
MMSLTSPLLPRGPIDVRDHLHTLPDDGSIPGMAGWEWVHTPGHTPGHVSLWRGRDRTLISGDAVITTRQESVYDAVMQRPEVHGPPMYFTPDWGAARDSVRLLASLEPRLLVTGHGRALAGPVMLDALRRLASNFDQVAVPHHGAGRARAWVGG